MTLALATPFLFLVGFTASAASEPEKSPAKQLAAAVQAGSVAQVKRLLRAGVPPNTTFAYTRCENIDSYVERRRPVLVAALGAPTAQPTCHIGWMAERSRLVPGQPEIVRALLVAGADPEFRADDYCPPLCFAARHSPAKVVELMLNHGADPQRRHQCASYLHQAAGNYRADTVQLLLRHGTDLHLRDDKGATPLFEAVSGEAWPPGRLSDQIRTVRLLLHRQVVNTPNESGTTPLMRAATWGNVPVMKLLVNQGADLHATDDRGYTALMFAADNGSAASIRWLLGRGSRLTPIAKDGETAFTRAAKRAKCAEKSKLSEALSVLQILESHVAGIRDP